MSEKRWPVVQNKKGKGAKFQPLRRSATKTEKQLAIEEQSKEAGEAKKKLKLRRQGTVARGTGAT